MSRAKESGRVAPAPAQAESRLKTGGFGLAAPEICEVCHATGGQALSLRTRT